MVAKMVSQTRLIDRSIMNFEESVVLSQQFSQEAKVSLSAETCIQGSTGACTLCNRAAEEHCHFMLSSMSAADESACQKRKTM
jgi:hypothetical protein